MLRGTLAYVSLALVCAVSLVPATPPAADDMLAFVDAAIDSGMVDLAPATAAGPPGAPGHGAMADSVLTFYARWDDGETLAGYMRLSAQGTFSDHEGLGGASLYQEQQYRLFARYVGARCDALFVGTFQDSEALIGRMFCGDGSERQGVWSAWHVPHFQRATSGCPMAHCDPALTDQMPLAPPEAGATLLWHDAQACPDAGPMYGSETGLGCVSNGAIAACTLGRREECAPGVPLENALIVYGLDEDGLPRRVWTSGVTLNRSAWTSAPIISDSGGVIAADSSRVVRFGPTGNLLWRTSTPGGIPISPVITGDGAIVLGKSDGPLSVYDNRTGALLSEIDLISGDGRFETVNTPAVQGNRVYLVTHHSENDTQGRLYAIDIPDPGSGPAPSQVAWSFDFGARSGASPVVVGDTVFFDGNRLTWDGPFDPHLFAVRDLGDVAELAWIKPMPDRVQASLALDPRGGLWAFSVSESGPEPDNRWLMRVDTVDNDGDGFGDVIESIDIDALVAESTLHVPSSAMTMAGTETEPVVILSATAVDTDNTILSSFVIAVDLDTATLRWKAALPEGFSAGQFPVVTGPSGPRVLFSSQTDGVRAIGVPAP